MSQFNWYCSFDASSVMFTGPSTRTVPLLQFAVASETRSVAFSSQISTVGASFALNLPTSKNGVFTGLGTSGGRKKKSLLPLPNASRCAPSEISVFMAG